MKSLKSMSVIVALGVVFVMAAAPAMGQGTTAQQPPPTTPPAAPAPAAPPPAPAPFPEGAKVAFIIARAIFETSEYGKSAKTRLEALEKKLTGEIQEKMKALEANRTKLQQGGSVLNAAAAAQLQKEIEKQERDVQFSQQDANSELQAMQQSVLEDFQVLLNPVLEEVRKEKGLHMIFEAGEGGLAAADAGLNVSAEVVKRLDAAKPAAPADKK